jgi:hypothetical protein
MTECSVSEDRVVRRNYELNAFPKTSRTSNSLEYGACSIMFLKLKAQTHFQHFTLLYAISLLFLSQNQ